MRHRGEGGEREREREGRKEKKLRLRETDRGRGIGDNVRGSARDLRNKRSRLKGSEFPLFTETTLGLSHPSSLSQTFLFLPTFLHLLLLLLLLAGRGIFSTIICIFCT